jgi:hypothetical protein
MQSLILSNVKKINSKKEIKSNLINAYFFCAHRNVGLSRARDDLIIEDFVILYIF